MRDGTDPIQDVVDRLAQTAGTAKARGALRTELTILLMTRTGPMACHIQSSHPGI
jgi:hypothetical protein